MANAQQLYEQALKELANGQAEEAIRLLGDALQEDDGYLPAWIKLAELMPDDDDKFDVLEQILQIDPDNEFALAEWDRLNALAEGGATAPAAESVMDALDFFRADDDEDEEESAEPEQAAPPIRREIAARDDDDDDDSFDTDVDDEEEESSQTDKIYNQVDGVRQQVMGKVEQFEGKYLDPMLKRFEPGAEVIPGVDRREFGRTVGIMLAFTIFMCMCSNLVISVSNNQKDQVVAEETRLAMEVTGIALTADANRTQVAGELTAVALSITETAQVLFTPEPTATNTPFVELPTEIPPSATPTEVVIQARIFGLPPASATGRLLAWGGNNPGSRQFLFLQSVDPASGAITQLNEDLVAYPSTDMLRSRIIYTQFDARNNDIRLVQVSGEQPTQDGELMSLVWSTGGVREESRAVLAASGNYVVFIARTDGDTNDIFLYDFLNRRLRRITRDAFNYRNAGIAAGGSQIVAVKEASSGVDLVLIDVLINTEPEDLPQTLLTNDGNLSVEDSPQFSPNGLYVVYHSASASAPSNNNIMFYDLNTRTATPIAAESADERYPYFSPDSRFIVYSSNVTGAYNLFVYDTISQATFQVTESTLAPVFAAGWSN